MATSATETLFCGGRLIEVVPSAGCASAHSASAGGGCGVAARAEHLHRICHDVETGALLAFLVLPFARLNAAFNVDHRALLQILLANLGQLSPRGDAVPFGALLALAIAVFVGFVGGHGEVRDGLAASGVARFGIAAQSADENHLIYGHGTPLRRRR